MAQNSLYPGFIKLHHEATLSEHIYTLPVKPFQSVGGDWWLEESGIVQGEEWVAALTRYVTVAKAFLNTAHTFTYAELWTMASADADPIYRATAELTIAGTSATAYAVASQITFSYRTSEGGNGKLVLLDSVYVPNAKLRPPYTGVPLAFYNYLMSNNCCVYGRDGGYPIAMPKLLVKTNDVLRRKYNLT